MPDKKKKCHDSTTCMSPSRRMVLQSMEIRDITHRVIRIPSTVSSPTPSTSNLCSCNEEYCVPNACGKPQPPVQASGGPPGQTTAACPQTCKMFDGVMVDAGPCCQEMLRKLAEESLAFNQVEERGSIPETNDPSTCPVPCCVENNPVPSTATCLSKSNCQVDQPPVVKKISCPACQEAQRLQEKKERQDDTCSIDSCAKNPKPKKKLQCSEACESKDKVPELQSSFCTHQQFRNKPYCCPIPPRTSSGTIGGKSNGKLSKKEKKAIKDEKKKQNGKNKNELEQSCNHEKCIANKPCPCRFPPAYNQHYNCTGEISGNCSCGEDK